MMLNKVRSFTLILLLSASLTPLQSRANNSFSQGTVPFVTDTSFSKEVSYHHGPVLVLFGAEWAAPAKEVAGYYDKVASQLEGKVKLMKFDIDVNPVLPLVF